MRDFLFGLVTVLVLATAVGLIYQAGYRRGLAKAPIHYIVSEGAGFQYAMKHVTSGDRVTVLSGIYTDSRHSAFIAPVTPPDSAWSLN